MAYEENKVGGNGHVAVHDWAPVDEKGNHKDSRRIEGDIEQTRHTMDEIMDALSGRLNPRSAVDRVMDYFQRPENKTKARDAVVNVGHRLSDSFERNPLPAIMIGAGITWALWENTRPVGRIASDSPGIAEKTSQKISSAVSSVKDSVSSKIESARHKEQDLGEGFTEKSESYGQKAHELKERLQHGYKENMDRAGQKIHDNSLLFGAGALFLGVVAGMLVPESRKEQEILGEQARKTIDQAKEKGNEAAENAADIAAKSADQVRERGVLPEGEGYVSGKPEEENRSKPVEPPEYPDFDIDV